jgi:hypothetical protein
MDLPLVTHQGLEPHPAMRSSLSELDLAFVRRAIE